MNETHSLLPEQEALLNKKFGNWEIFPVPASGWKLGKMRELAKELSKYNVVFCSPIPALMIMLTDEHFYTAGQCEAGEFFQMPVWTFHNDRRKP